MENYASVYVQISTQSNNIMIVTIYRHRKVQAADDTALYEEIKSIIQNKQALIIGDFNCPSIDWSSMNGDREGNRLIEMAEDAFQFKQNNDCDYLLVPHSKSGRRHCTVWENQIHNTEQEQKEEEEEEEEKEVEVEE